MLPTVREPSTSCKWTNHSPTFQAFTKDSEEIRTQRLSRLYVETFSPVVLSSRISPEEQKSTKFHILDPLRVVNNKKRIHEVLA